MEDLNSNVRMHKLTMINRKNVSLSGVNDVLSFDIHEILLETEQGMLMIKGEDLHVSRLSLEQGEVNVEGKIDSFTYSEVVGGTHKTESFLSRLFG